MTPRIGGDKLFIAKGSSCDLNDVEKQQTVFCHSQGTIEYKTDGNRERKAIETGSLKRRLHAILFVLALVIMVTGQSSTATTSATIVVPDSGSPGGAAIFGGNGNESSAFPSSLSATAASATADSSANTIAPFLSDGGFVCTLTFLVGLLAGGIAL